MENVKRKKAPLSTTIPIPPSLAAWVSGGCGETDSILNPRWPNRKGSHRKSLRTRHLSGSTWGHRARWQPEPSSSGMPQPPRWRYIRGVSTANPDCPEQVGDKSRWKLSPHLNIHRHWQNKAEFHSNYSIALGKQENNIISNTQKAQPKHWSERLVLAAASLEVDCAGGEVLNKMLQANAFIGFIWNWDAILQEDVLINFVPFPSSGDGIHDSIGEINARGRMSKCKSSFLTKVSREMTGNLNFQSNTNIFSRKPDTGNINVLHIQKWETHLCEERAVVVVEFGWSNVRPLIYMLPSVLHSVWVCAQGFTCR